MKVCGRRSVCWIAGAWKWLLKRLRYCWSQTGDPFSTRGLFSEKIRLSGKQESSTWRCTWIEGLASQNTYRSRLQGHPIWSKLGSAHAQYWWTQGSKEKTVGERGAFEATLCSFCLVWSPTKPCTTSIKDFAIFAPHKKKFLLQKKNTRINERWKLWRSYV